MCTVLIEGPSGAFHGRMDPEELFRQIFGDRGFQMSGFDDFDAFEDSDFGFATASHVSFDVWNDTMNYFRFCNEQEPFKCSHIFWQLTLVICIMRHSAVVEGERRSPK